MFEKFQLFPRSASTYSGEVDLLFFFLCGISVIFSAGILAAILYFSIRYRRGRNPRATQVHGSIPLEIIWSVIPLMISLVSFFWGASLFFDIVQPSARGQGGGLDIYVTGKQWMWKLQHPDGQREINALHVPVNTPVNLTMISEDVIHSFYVPAFRMKRDVVPGRYSRAWFEATETGEFKLLCAEYCGTKHSKMIGSVHVLEQEEYERWLDGNLSGETPAQLGEKLFDQMRCASCHNQQAGARGPLLEGRLGTLSTLDDGSQVLFDEAYLRESIYRPLAKKVVGWDPVMPTYEGQISEEQVLHLFAYLQTLEGDAPVAAPPRSQPDASETEAPGAELEGQAGEGEEQ